MQTLSDNELVKSCLSGNHVHAKLIYERYKKYLERVIRNMGNDEETVEDLLQETFVRAFNGLKSFEKKSTFKTWITKIAINTTRNFQSKRRRRNKYPKVSLDSLKDEDGLEIELRDGSGNPQKQILDKEIKTVVDAALELMSDKHREVIILWSEGFSYDEIGEIIKASPKTVGSRLHYARCQLQKILIPYLKGN